MANKSNLVKAPKTLTMRINRQLDVIFVIQYFNQIIADIIYRNLDTRKTFIYKINTMAQPIELHPFTEFVPAHATTLILGSFPGKESTQQKRPDDWYYGANRNQFWKILEIVYDRPLTSLKEKQKLFEEYGIAITDIIKSCKRMNDSAADKNLSDKIYNTEVIKSILSRNKIEKILFTSKGVEEEFTVHIESSIEDRPYKKVVLITPSPVYRRENIEQKAEKYKKELPQFTAQELKDRFRERFGGSEGITITK